METYILPEKNRAKLREVYGTPIFGNESNVRQQFDDFARDKNYELIITIGDYCSTHLKSDIKIFDGFVQRQKFEKTHPRTLTLKNPAGTIQKESWAIIKKAIKNKENIFVDGEEDLLVIPAAILAPQNSLVVYGLPNKGICVLEINDSAKKLFQSSLENLSTAE